MRAAVRFMRECIRDGFPDTWARVTAAGTLGALALDVAGLAPTDTLRFLVAWWGAGAAIYAAILWAAAPADVDQHDA